MEPLDVLLFPLRAGQLVVRAADDLNAVAERARRDPDPVEEVRDLLAALQVTASQIVVGGDDLRRTAERLDAHTVELISGGQELTETAKVLEDSVETVADTVEPLQGVARRVGRRVR